MMNDGHFEIKIETLSQSLISEMNNQQNISSKQVQHNYNERDEDEGAEDEEEENEERKRFQVELEFVQSLANPDYLNYLAQRGYFKNETFLNYLKYLMYWKEPEYVKYITYPQCLALLDLLQHEQFLKEIANNQCAKYITDQLLLLWIHYKRTRKWTLYDPTKVPNNVSKLFKFNLSNVDHDHNL